MGFTTIPNLREISFVFLKLGTTAFGGPAAHLAMMEEELVRKKNWLSKEEFLDLISVANLIPGPNSTEVAIHVGYKLGGWRGLLLAGTSFVLPAFLIVWSIAWFYLKFESVPIFQTVFLGIKPVILAIVAQAIWSLSKTALKDRLLMLLGLFALILFLSEINEIIILLTIALTNFLLRSKKIKSKLTLTLMIPILTGIFFTTYKVLAAELSKQVPAETLFGYFVKIGSVLFGSGYVLIAFLQNDLVNNYHWITDKQLLDAIAVGQFTPGPVFTTATFIGYLVSGNSGAIVSTIGIFLPAFFFVALTVPIINRLRKSNFASIILDGLNVASLSLMAGASFILGKDFLFSIQSSFIFLISLFLLLKFKINSVWLIVGFAVVSFLI